MFVAVVLDVLQFTLFVFFFTMMFITPLGGALAGAVVGCNPDIPTHETPSAVRTYLMGIPGFDYAFKAGDFLNSSCKNGVVAPFVGAAAGAGISTFAIPIGVAVNMVLSITVGGGIILLLAFRGMFYPQIIIKKSLLKVAPFLNILPFWSLMVWQCFSEKKRQQGAASSGVVGKAFGLAAGAAAGAIPGGGLIRGAVRFAQQRFASTQNQQTQGGESAEQKSSRAPLLPSRFSDIRPAVKGAALALLLIIGAHAHAQTVPDPIQYIVTPETPGANETVLIEVQGVGSFLGSADITWKKDGKTVKNGIGERSFSFVTGALGQKTTVTVAIDSSQGPFTQTFIFNPSRINLLWEAYTTVPPLYKGKALYSAGSDYKVVAFPTVYSGAARINANALTYQWFYHDDPVPEASGLGRFTFSRTGDQLQPSEDIAVDVYYGAAKVGHGELSVPVSDPFIKLYSRDALRGTLYDAALPAAISLVGREITVQAEPYYFSAAAKKSGMIPFVWTLNDEPASGPDSAGGILTLRQSGSGTGSATIGVSMQNNNPDQFVQTAESSLHIEFGAKQGSSLLNFFGI